MKRRFVILALLAAFTLGGQDTTRKYYVARSVTGTLNRITIRQAASNPRALRLDGVFFSSSVVATPTISKLGTLTGGSAGASLVTSLDDRGPATPSAVVTLDGTVGSGTTVFSRDIPAAGERAHGGGLHLAATSGTEKQITLELTSSGSGVLYIYAEFSEP